MQVGETCRPARAYESDAFCHTSPRRLSTTSDHHLRTSGRLKILKIGQVNLAHAGVYKELQSIPAGGQWKESFWITPSGF
jgi:hypothetical protein